VTYVNFAPSKTPQKRNKTEQKRNKTDTRIAKTYQKPARFALPILTFETQNPPHEPETGFRGKKNAHFPVSATSKLT